MLPPEILKQYPGDGTFWYLLSTEHNDTLSKNDGETQRDAVRKIMAQENLIGWLTMDEHICLERVEPELFRCAVESGIALNASYVTYFPASAVRSFVKNCSNKLNAPAVSHNNRWLDYVGYRVQSMLQTAASKNCGIYLDWD